MAKQFLVELNYGQYAMSGEDAILLMQIANRAVKVKRPDYRRPYRPVDDQESFAESVALAEVLPADPDPPAVEPIDVPQLKEGSPF